MGNDTTHWHIGTRLGRGFSLIGDRGKEIETGDSLPLMSQPGWPLVSDDGSQKETMTLVGKIDFLEVGLHEEIVTKNSVFEKGWTELID